MAFTVVALLIGPAFWLVLFGIALYQLFKLLTETIKRYQRLIYVGIIFLLNFISFANPTGIIDWEKFEGESLLVAESEGVANCQTIIQLKKNNRFKYISRCFGVDFYLGTYKLKHDTLYFELCKDAPYMDKSSYATLFKSKTDTTIYGQMNLYKNHEDNRNISFSIKEVKMKSR